MTAVTEVDRSFTRPSTAWIGNDVVDLGTSGALKPARFVARTCTEGERAWLAAQPGQHERWLWSLWAAKEAAHKALAKRAPRVFSPIRLEVAGDLRSVWAHDEGLCLPLILEAGPTDDGPTHDGMDAGTDAAGVRSEVGYVHALSWLAGPHAASKVELRRGITRRGIDDESRAVRQALYVAEAHRRGVARERLQVRREAGGWPRLLLDGRPTDVDVSLSHDGRYVAWAVAG